MARETKAITVTVPTEDKQWLDEQAEQRDEIAPNRSAIVRKAIDALRQQQGGEA